MHFSIVYIAWHARLAMIVLNLCVWETMIHMKNSIHRIVYCVVVVAAAELCNEMSYVFKGSFDIDIQICPVQIIAL